MTTTRRELTHPDSKRAELRTLVNAVEVALDRDESVPLRAAWRELVDKLALGPEPELRACPACGATCMQTATRCGHCWTELAAS
ncbi:MAG: hypothetical protein HS111_35875 [Kofleriaceae bacterium]|nr:hypothetical protein [Kofleriaceae bacterium]